MTSIKQVTLSRLNLNNDKVSCTGEQLAMILKEVESQLDEPTWYAVDVLARNYYCLELYEQKEGRQIPFKVGTTQDLVNFALPVPQFESGIFLAVPTSLGPNITWSPNSFNTEDQEFIEPCTFMIRAFDTSYFEVLSKDEDIIDRIVRIFIRRG
jgi:hypothetical protein